MSDSLLISKLAELSEGLKFIAVARKKNQFNKYLKQLQTLLVNNFDDNRKEAINEAIRYLNSVGHDDFSKADINKINKIISDKFGENLSKAVEKTVKSLNQKIFKTGIKEVGSTVDMQLSFSVNDKKSADILSKNVTLFWIGDYYSENLNQKINTTLTGYFTDNKTVKDVAKEFQSDFKNKTDKGITYMEQLADYSTHRIANLGRVTGFEKAGIESYEIVAVLDDRTSDVCEEMNGKIFPVQQGIDFRDKLLSADSPEDIKEIAPWRSGDEIKDKSVDDLPAGLELPPYHFGGCRTIAVAHFG